VVHAGEGGYRLQPGKGVPISVHAPNANLLKPLVGREVRARAKVIASPDTPYTLELTDIR
jgi:hypothetical protein